MLCINNSIMTLELVPSIGAQLVMKHISGEHLFPVADGFSMKLLFEVQENSRVKD